MEEFEKLLKSYTVITILVIIIIATICGLFIVGFKADYNITGVEREKIGFSRSYNGQNVYIRKKL